MASEIERKFLVDKESWNSLKKPQPKYIKQAFILKDDKKVTRIRITSSKALLTIKGKSNGISRLEFEYEIPMQDAEEMISNLGGNIIEKDRFEIKNQNHTWEVDVFYGENEGLIVAEIELDSEDESFDKPIWIAKEVSDDVRYFNSNLESNPYSKW